MTPAAIVPAAAERTSANLDAARLDVKAEIARTDNKVALLLAFVSVVLAGVFTVGSGRRLPALAAVVGGSGVLLLVVVSGLLLWAVRPNLGSADSVGFPYWARLSAAEIRSDLAGDDRAEHIAALSRIAVAKFIHLRRAVDLTCAALALLVTAALLAL